MFGHLGGDSTAQYFIPEEGGFEWHKNPDRSTPDYVIGLKRRFDSHAAAGTKLEIAIGARGMGDHFEMGVGGDNSDSEITIEDLIIGERGVKIQGA
jgi:hypothetical protein